ncbi:MAG: CCA tRNA nucleotidyltransferase [Deltaproteobacteria bacterium]|nr:CCA tRNA nucleotidyltransferase [Deltaproteobacteria bacterium]
MKQDRNNILDFHKRVIPPQFIVNAINRLNAAGFEAYLVGGAVRDAYVGRRISDWDVTTSASFDEINSLFSDTKRYSLKYETVILVDSGHDYEVTTFRRHGSSAPSLEEDLRHRDFTINAMCYDVSGGKIFDPHNGRMDIRERTLRAVGNPEERFMEDPVRLLRAIRFSVELGFKIEKRTMDKILEMSEGLNSVAGEKIRDELMKILISPRPSGGFYMMKKANLLKHFLPELEKSYLKRQNSYHKYTIFKHIMVCVDSVRPDPILRLAALFHDIAKPFVREKVKGEFKFHGHEEASALMAGDIMRRLKFSRKSIRKVCHLISHHMIGYESSWKDSTVRRLIGRVGIENIDDLMHLRRSDLIAHGIMDDKIEKIGELKSRIEELNSESIGKGLRGLAIDGKKVMKILNIGEGPAVGNVLGALLEKVMEYPELNNQKDLVEIVERIIKGH